MSTTERKKNITLVGRLDNHSGYGHYTSGYMDALSTDFNIFHIDTKLEQGNPPELENTKCKQKHQTPVATIFTDVLWNGQHDYNWKKVPNDGIKIANCCFDSSLLPKQWVNILNTSFDLVVVPCTEMITVCKNSAVTKPVIYLPIPCSFENLEKQKLTGADKNPTITYGFVGSLEPRKNVPILIDAFLETFGGYNPNIQLRIHITYSHMGRNIINLLTNRHAGSSIVITFGQLNRSEYSKLINSFNCFISLSKGEGYSFIPREIMHLGKPIILSDTLAHKDICKAQGAYPIPCTVPYPAYYPQLDGIISGVQYSPYIEDIKILWKRYHKQIQNESPQMFANRIQWADQLTYAQLRRKYKNLIEPNKIEKGSQNEVFSDKLVLSDERLIQKYKDLSLEQNPKSSNCITIQDKEIHPNKTVVIAHDGGFFSVLNKLVSIVNWQLKENPKSVVLPDWRISKMKRHLGTSSFTSFCYGKETDGNLFIKFFEPIPYSEIQERMYNDENLLYLNANIRDDFNEENEPLLTYINAYYLYKRADFLQWREWYHECYKRYFQPKKHIVKKVDALFKTKLEGAYLIGVHPRHPSHGIEQVSGKAPPLEKYFELVQQSLEKAYALSLRPKIFLATDQETTLSRFNEEFPGLVVTQMNINRIQPAQDIHFNSLTKEEQMKEGFQLQHIIASDPNEWSTTLAEEVIVDAMLLAKCDELIHITSNVATAVSYMNPKVKMIYCE